MNTEEQPKHRPMNPEDWTRIQIPPGTYLGEASPIHGFQRVDGLCGNALHPVDTFEDHLQQTFGGLQESCPGVTVACHHVLMPYWNQGEYSLPTTYTFVAAPERLSTTSVTVVLSPQASVTEAEMGFYMDGENLRPLTARMEGLRFRGIAGNLGYRMTQNLVADRHPWSHALRFPHFPLPTLLSYLGFYYFRDETTGQVVSSFQGAHPSAVGIRKDGSVEILPCLEFTKYAVTLWGETLTVDSIDNPDNRDEVMLFTPGLWTSEVRSNADNWTSYAPEISIPGRVNIFIANQGNGSQPVEKVVKIWKGRAPLPSFGALLSLSERRFETLSAKATTTRQLGERVTIEPLEGTDLADFTQVLGGLVPAVIGGHHLYCLQTVDQALEALQRFGNATSPIAEAGRESRNFDLRIREPAGVFVQTTDRRIGWVLFDGRHELSIGATIVDVAWILTKLEEVDGFEIENAVFVDGGSAMKVYAIDGDSTKVKLDLLNRVAAGSRNGPGSDPEGLNLYTLLRLGLAA